jgi:SAM-dependent methyltransferase
VVDSDYSPEFFADHVEKARSSAEAIVPHVLELVAPGSVVDFGCGVGTWLATFARHGVADYLGVDGEWVSPEMLEIPRERFVPARLDRPFELGRRFDLAVSLEVAEHLPESAASAFVRSVAEHAPCVLFSAAVPHQGGLHHLNEQWPEYWVELFAEYGHLVVDAIRPRIWTTPGVAFWYRQNTFLYARPEVLAAHPLLATARAHTNEKMLSVVHPRLLTHVAGDPAEHMRRLTAREHSLRELAYAAPHVAARSLRWWVGKLLRRST